MVNLSDANTKVMTIISNPLKYLLTVVVLTELVACAPLRFSMYLRNMTKDTTYLTFIHEAVKENGKKY
jgi:hypothetical protein